MLNIFSFMTRYVITKTLRFWSLIIRLVFCSVNSVESRYMMFVTNMCVVCCRLWVYICMASWCCRKTDVSKLWRNAACRPLKKIWTNQHASLWRKWSSSSGKAAGRVLQNSTLCPIMHFFVIVSFLTLNCKQLLWWTLIWENADSWARSFLLKSNNPTFGHCIAPDF